jgi:hypothetical protein
MNLWPFEEESRDFTDLGEVGGTSSLLRYAYDILS